MQPAGKTVHGSGRGLTLSSCGIQGATTVGQASSVLTTEGQVGASPAMDYLGPGQSGVKLNQGDDGIVGLPRLLQAFRESDPPQNS